MLKALNWISEKQAHLTQNTESAITHFHDYAPANPNTVLKFWASDMVLHIDSDA